MTAVEFGPDARAELDAAAEAYERERPGLGLRFYDAIERAVRVIAALPEAGPWHPTLEHELGVRQRVVRGFPFVLAYRDLGDRIRIDAVAHTHRRPGYWRSRIK